MQVATSVYASTRSKTVAEKVKADYLMLFQSIPVLAVNDSGFVWMDLQSTLQKSLA
jgi:hypothetical protein